MESAITATAERKRCIPACRKAKATARTQSETEWQEQARWVRDLPAYCEAKGDRLMAERLREPKAIVFHAPAIDRVVLFGEQHGVSARLRDKDLREAQEELDGLIHDYTEHAVKSVGLGGAPWRWKRWAQALPRSSPTLCSRTG